MLVGSNRYTPIARIFHWVMAVPIIILLLLGQQTMDNHEARILPTLHASAGLVIIVMVAFRLYWRWKNPPPPPNLTLRPWEHFASRWAHVALYLAMILIPLTGWFAYTEHVHRSLGVRSASWFGYKIPLLPDFSINWHRIHNWGGKLVLALIAVHVAAALKHHLIDRDDTLKRMLP